MDCRRTIVTLALLAAFAVTLVVSPVGHAGILDAVKQKVKEKTTKKTADATDKAMDDAEKSATGKKGGEESGDATRPAAGGGGSDDGKVSTVSTKFDFVPGDSVLFYDDFTQDDLGEFPAKWKLVQGNFEVAEMAGERWLRCTSPDAHIQMKAPPSLPEFWTLELDLYEKDEPTNFTLTVTALSKEGSEIWMTHFPYGDRDLAFRCGEVFSQTPLEGSPKSGRHHFMFSGRGTALKVYMERQRMANVPDVTGPGKPAVFDLRLFANDQPMITKVRFAEGPRPPKDMLAEGKLVTHGILFDTGSDVVLPESAPVLRQVAAYLETNAQVKLRITGHTDNVGSAAGNLDLSKRRAASVAKVLSTQFSVDAGRFETDGKGDTKPISSNAKPEGRAMNRRVEFAKL